MGQVIAWQGLPNVIRNLNRKINQIKGNSLLGLIRGASFIKKSMDSTPPLIPIDTGNMRRSWFIITNNEGIRAGRNPIFTEGKYKDRNVSRLQSDHARALSSAGSMVKGKEPAIAVGFSAYYTMYVHENVGAHFQRPGAGAKFFEAAIKNSTRQILNMVRLEARIK
jgi:hypothetical protein